jgi:hypothetical protein
MPLFGRRRGSEPPDPWCVFVVGCTAEEPPPLEALAGEADPVAETRLEEATGGSDRLPPEDTWPALGLTPELAERFEQARYDITITLRPPNEPIAAAVLELTRLADRVADLAVGSVHDPAAQRFFGPGSWRVPDPLAEVDVREHVTVHAVGAEAPEGAWIHTHGLIKFGRPEFEIYDVPEDMAAGTAAALNDLGQYVITGAFVAPGQTVGDPSVPLQARVGDRDPDHWGGIPVLELVDVDERGKPGRGATQGLRAWWPENFLEK